MLRRAQLGREMIVHLPALRRYAPALSGNLAVADDLVQDCIERALRRLDSLQNAEKMAAWLRSILFNLFIDDRRHLSARVEKVEIDVLASVPDFRAQPDRQYEANEVLQATMALTPEHRQILVLVGVEGLSYRDVADELNLPLGTVMSRLARAREKLRQLLDEDRPPKLVCVGGRDQ